ncbi:hypothetical protein ACTXT7_006463 [Hymenolepis weldensis]
MFIEEPSPLESQIKYSQFIRLDTLSVHSVHLGERHTRMEITNFSQSIQNTMNSAYQTSDNQLKLSMTVLVRSLEILFGTQPLVFCLARDYGCQLLAATY